MDCHLVRCALASCVLDRQALRAQSAAAESLGPISFTFWQEGLPVLKTFLFHVESGWGMPLASVFVLKPQPHCTWLISAGLYMPNSVMNDWRQYDLILNLTEWLGTKRV